MWRFNLLEVWTVLAWDYGLYGLWDRIEKMGFRPHLALVYDSLTEEQKHMYRQREPQAKAMRRWDRRIPHNVGYWDVSVVVEGALESAEIFEYRCDAIDYLKHKYEDTVAHNYVAEIYILRHEHSPYVEDCTCVQYETDHHPTFIFPRDGNQIKVT